MDDANDLAILTRVGELFEQLCATIQGDQWDLQTPCSEWKLDRLVDHVTGGNRFTTHILNGQSAEQAMASAVESFGPSHQPGEAAILSSKSMRSSFDKQGVLDRLCHHIGGDMPGRAVLRLRLHDMIIHSWDVAQTLYPPATLPPELVSWALTELSDPNSLSGRHFDLDTSALTGAQLQSPQAELLAAFGR